MVYEENPVSLLSLIIQSILTPKALDTIRRGTTWGSIPPHFAHSPSPTLTGPNGPLNPFLISFFTFALPVYPIKCIAYGRHSMSNINILIKFFTVKFMFTAKKKSELHNIPLYRDEQFGIWMFLQIFFTFSVFEQKWDRPLNTAEWLAFCPPSFNNTSRTLSCSTGFFLTATLYSIVWVYHNLLN